MADNRIYLRMKRGSQDPLFDNAILAPMKKFGGILFPYTPQIQHRQAVSWTALPITHANYQPLVYNHTESPNIVISSAKFTATTTEDAEYMLAVMFFLKMTTKMHFGTRDANRGTPPPVLELSGHGQSQYSNVPVVIADFNYTYPNEIDYVTVLPQYASNAQQTENVPVVMELSITLQIQQNIKRTRDEFSLADLASGALAGKGYI